MVALVTSRGCDQYSGEIQWEDGGHIFTITTINTSNAVQEKSHLL